MPTDRPDPTSPARTALIVDDFPSVRAYHSLILTKAGYNCRAAQDGREALALLHDSVVDIVVLDLGMPGMSGQEFVDHLHANAAWARVAVLVISAEARAEGIRQAATPTTGPVGFVRKPLKPATILAEVARLVAGPGSR